MRYLLCLLGGLLLGGMLALTVSNSLQRRNPWPRAVMHVMQHELGAARDAARANQCATPAAASASAHLVLLSRDIERAILKPGTADKTFSRYADDLRASIDRADATRADCAANADALTAVSNACDACHRDYQ